MLVIIIIMADKNDELIDVCTVDGALTGVSKTRKEIHDDGDWHRIGELQMTPKLHSFLGNVN